MINFTDNNSTLARDSALIPEKTQAELAEHINNSSTIEGTELGPNDSKGAKEHVHVETVRDEEEINPFEGLTKDQVAQSAFDFAIEHGLEEEADVFARGAMLAYDGSTDQLEEDELMAYDKEVNHKWAGQPLTLYYMAIMCAMCAVVQGMDETVINGAQLYFVKEFGMDKMKNSEWLIGMVVGAPYLCSFALGCALTGPLNNLLGRRGVIFLSCFIAGAASIWESFTYSWVQMFLARLLLGLGIGPKSSTVPVFSAECAPARTRGAFVMMWQMWTAFGIMLGFIVDVVFLPRGNLSETVAWRLMMGSTVVAPIFVCLQVYFVPESPRWYLKKNRIGDAYRSLCRYRSHRILAARDLYYMYLLTDISDKMNQGSNPLADIFKVGRNRRALYASQIVMFMQQFCGVNIIAYFSSQIFADSGYSVQTSILVSMGFGILNFLFALPAVFTIDTFGRRSLVLFTLPFLSLMLLFTGCSFWIPHREARVGCITLGIYLYAIFYSPGMGPVPFTYSAEAFPLHVRDVGMSMATITLWGFNFLLSLTWPALLKAFKPQGAFGYYAAWNVIGFVLVFLFVPETKALSLEELDRVFSVPTSKFIKSNIAGMFGGKPEKDEEKR
ncbi:uncharacterized protein SAPINGB_P000468 [Magnusiomyces paraingens]|uniref:Major facilitator superfamily (MFS) profile domain-containing protein n=1 Tax=Magnusiomyces paraingens TaxID=2606893 RepID=A0A5E8AZF8_9ASCO|nr:uncharacterized protein SAPINGB_P000468 [Saprochaete ingens]VVT44594.1 unnamed protein product [Saprochaete ingens]